MDIISDLPDAIIAHILSFLPTKEAASTSILSKRWRLLFAQVLNLDFDDSVYVHPREDKYDAEWNEFPTTFMQFVERVLALQEDKTVNKFSLRCRDGVDLDRATSWIENVLKRGVSDLDLNLEEFELPFPSEIFVSQTLVKLNIEQASRGPLNDEIDHVSLPNLKTLYLRAISFDTSLDELVKLFSGCPVLEELVLMCMVWYHETPRYISITTLKRLTLYCEDMGENPISVSFDTPNLVYLEYTDFIAKTYPTINLGSLIEARIYITLTPKQRKDANDSDGDEEKQMVGNATKLFMGLRNVQILFLTARSLEVLTFCCEGTPVFNNLVHLTIENDKRVVWKALPGLLNNCPNLETLVFRGLNHRRTDECGNMCRCEPLKNPSCLSSSPVKVLKVYMRGHMDDIKMETGQIKLFLEKMPRLEQLIVYFDTSSDHDVYQISMKLQKIPKIASAMCKIQAISQNLSLSSTLPSSVSKIWSTPQEEKHTWFLSPLS